MKKSGKRLLSAILSAVIIISTLYFGPIMPEAASRWVPIASSDFSSVSSVSRDTAFTPSAYNGMGGAISWVPHSYTAVSRPTVDNGAVYIPNGYMYMSAYDAENDSYDNLVPINGTSAWKIDFGFRFKTDDSDNDNYEQSDDYCFLKMYVYQTGERNPAQKNAACCYFAQNANGVCYSWEDDEHNAGVQSKATSITTNNGNLVKNTNYHYIAEYTGDVFKAYITDESGNTVQNIAETTDETFLSRLSNIAWINIDAIKIGDDDNSYFYKGLEYRNITFYCEETDPEIHFDMAQRETLFKGSTGFLYGEAEINVPSIDLLQGLKPDTMVQKAYGGKQHPTGDAIRTGSALNAAGVRDMQIYLQDYYLEWPYDAPYKDGSIDLDSYQKTVEDILYKMICDEANPNDDGAFLGSDGNYYTLNGRGDKYSYVLFNEPDNIWYGGNLEGLENAWMKIYRAVHAIDPNARCAGPNFAGYNQASYDAFLQFCYNNNCLPELITWHELGDISLTEFVVHYNQIKAMQAKYYTAEYAAKSGRDYQPELLVNEYARHYDIGSVGGLIKWLAMFEDKDMSGCMAYWAMANTLNEMAADQNSPASTWWVYHWYAQMTGEQCPLVSPAFRKTKFYGLTSYDEDINMGYVLFGGNEEKNGTETVYLDNFNATDLMNGAGATHVKIYGVPYSGQLGSNYKPEVIFEGNIKAEDNSLKIEINNTDEMEAYFAVLTKPEENAPISNADNLCYPYLNYEAEDAELLGGATAYGKTGWTEFATSGRKDVGSIINNGDGVRFTVNVPESGYYNASIFYSLQSPYVNPETLEPDANGQNRGIGKMLPYGMELDGEALDNIYLESTIIWLYKRHCDTVIYLTAGEHTITYKHINGDERDKGNLELSAALDKLTLQKIDGDENNFEICLDEMSNFKDGNAYRVTAVAPEAGYYTVTADGSFSLKKQCIDYAADATSFSECSVYDTEVGSTVYLAKGANTIVVEGNCTKLNFTYEGDKTDNASTVINSTDITINGINPIYKENAFANSGYVISELGVGQNSALNENAENNYSTFTVDAPSAGVYNFAIRYANDEPAPIMEKADGSTYIHPYNIDLVERYAQISVNGGEAETVYFKNTLSWETFRTLDVQLALNAGKNTIKIYNDNSYQFSNLVNSTAPEIDTVTVSKLTFDNEKVSLINNQNPETHLWTPIASSDFSSVNSVSQDTAFTPSTYNGMGNAIEWTAHAWLDNGNPSAGNGAVYLPDGYMYMSAYGNDNLVPISASEHWKIDFGFRFKTDDSDTGNYEQSDDYCFLKMFVYAPDDRAPIDKNAARCYFAQNANGVCYSWTDDGHNAGVQSKGTSLTANNGHLSTDTDYHYIAEYTGDLFRAYITDENGYIVQKIAECTDETFLSRLGNISWANIDAIKIGDDDDAYYFKGLEYRNITFYAQAEPDPTALKAAIEEARTYSYAEYTAESLNQLLEIADGYAELADSTATQAEYDAATADILSAISNLDKLSDYVLTAFEDGIATLENGAGNQTHLTFIDFINDYCAPLDVNEDGIVNIRDYSILRQMFN